MPRRSIHSNRQRLERAAEHYLDECYRKRTAARTEEFAEYLRVSRPYLSRFVREVTGISARAFLRKRQLEHAAHLLRTTPMRVDQIALFSGFGTLWTFHRWFRNAYGMTPGQYRKQVTK